MLTAQCSVSAEDADDTLRNVVVAEGHTPAVLEEPSCCGDTTFEEGRKIRCSVPHALARGLSALNDLVGCTGLNKRAEREDATCGSTLFFRLGFAAVGLANGDGKEGGAPPAKAAAPSGGETLRGRGGG